MSKAAERSLTGIAALLVPIGLSQWITGSEWLSQSLLSGVASVVAIAAAWTHKRNKRHDEKSPAPLEAAEGDQAVYAAAQAVESHGDPLGRWWRR